MADQIPLRLRIQEDMKSAMRAKDQPRLDAIRLIMAAIKQVEVDERIEPDDARVLMILDKMIKQRRDSIAQYEVAKRQDLIDRELFEINIIQNYLPAQLSATEIDQLISEAIAEVGASSVKDLGKLMTLLKTKLQGRADMSQVSAKVKERLA